MRYKSAKKQDFIYTPGAPGKITRNDDGDNLVTQVNPMVSGINGAILAHIAIDTAPHTVLRFGIRELKEHIAACLADLESKSVSVPGMASHQDDPNNARDSGVSIYAKTEYMKSAIEELQHKMDTTSANDLDGVYTVAKFAQSAFLLWHDLENMMHQDLVPAEG